MTRRVPALGTAMGGGTHSGTPPESESGVPSLDSAREKNRQAQRRFRERQKNLISELRSKVRRAHRHAWGLHAAGVRVGPG